MTRPSHRFLALAGPLAVVLAAVACSATDPPATAFPAKPATSVGRAACADCHETETQAWQGSHHDLAMQVADESTVLGDFDDASFTYAGTTSTFFRRDGAFLVRTDGPDGELRDYEIAYSFGIAPLQQYLIELPDGRLQALSICWDTRADEVGGQRWFHLYPDEAVDHEDELHWTGPNQNWNFMCAECHSTGVRKGYSAADDRFDTTWDEIDVSCEACHGPGSRHVDWARENPAPAGPAEGLTVQLADTDGGYWIPDPKTGLAARSVPRASRAEVETCARCHARRSAFTDEYVHGRPLMDTHRPALLEDGLYHADGQILDEVYVYGSLLQSRMYAAGVTCGDCHDAHSLELKAPGNGLCATCHAPDRFDSPSHHFHEPGTSGSACVDCHMPSRTYMVVDPRRDHGFRVPRPDLSVELGTPNACNDCHADRSADWAAATVAGWYDSELEPHFARALHAARHGLPGAEDALRGVVDDPEVPGIAGATAASLLGRYPSPESARTLHRATKHDDPLVRFGALQATESLPPAPRIGLAAPLLSDPVRAVRMEAARVLAPFPPEELSPEQRVSRDRALEEYRAAQRFNADRVEARLNLGLLDVQQGRPAQAERHYRDALAMAPGYAPAYANLADLYRTQGRDDEGERVLREGLLAAPDSAEVHHAMGLLLVRAKRNDEAMPFLERAAELRPGEARYGYVLGVALHSAGDSERALTVLREVLERHPGNRETLVALATISRDSGALDDAAGYARELLKLAPEDPEIRGFLNEIETAGAR